NIYVITGNGTFDGRTNNNFGDTFLKLSTTNGIGVTDFFTPFNQQSLADNDLDLGSSGAVLLPDAAGSVAHPHLLMGAGKEGTLYLLDRDNLGQFNPLNNSQIVQELDVAIGGVISSGAYFNNRIYWLGGGDVLKAFDISNAVINPTPSSQN